MMHVHFTRTFIPVLKVQYSNTYTYFNNPVKLDVIVVSSCGLIMIIQWAIH